MGFSSSAQPLDVFAAKFHRLICIFENEIPQLRNRAIFLQDQIFERLESARNVTFAMAQVKSEQRIGKQVGESSTRSIRVLASRIAFSAPEMRVFFSEKKGSRSFENLETFEAAERSHESITIVVSPVWKASSAWFTVIKPEVFEVMSLRRQGIPYVSRVKLAV